MIRERLLSVAIERFGESGFEGASTRDIAQAADTAMSSITYHFGGKEGLYLACADFIAEMADGRYPIYLGSKYGDVITYDYVRVWEHPKDQ